MPWGTSSSIISGLVTVMQLWGYWIFQNVMDIKYHFKVATFNKPTISERSYLDKILFNFNHSQTISILSLYKNHSRSKVYKAQQSVPFNHYASRRFQNIISNLYQFSRVEMKLILVKCIMLVFHEKLIFCGNLDELYLLVSLFPFCK